MIKFIVLLALIPSICFPLSAAIVAATSSAGATAAVNSGGGNDSEPFGQSKRIAGVLKCHAVSYRVKDYHENSYEGCKINRHGFNGFDVASIPEFFETHKPRDSLEIVSISLAKSTWLIFYGEVSDD